MHDTEDQCGSKFATKKLTHTAFKQMGLSHKNKWLIYTYKSDSFDQELRRALLQLVIQNSQKGFPFYPRRLQETLNTSFLRPPCFQCPLVLTCSRSSWPRSAQEDCI